MSDVTDAIEIAANAGDPNVGASRSAHATSSRHRVNTVRAIIMRFLEAIPDESLTVHDMRRAIEDGE